MLVGYGLGGQTGMLVALGLAAVSNGLMYWKSDSLVLKMQKAKPLGSRYPEVTRIVSDLAQQENIPMPRLYYVDTPVPNAFATGRSPSHAAVAVTAGIMELLTDSELRAVLAHELGHVKNRDMLISTIAATMAGAISYIAEFTFWFGGDRDGEGNPFASIFAIMLMPFAAMVIQLAVSRSREFLADEHSAHLLGSGRELESALTKLEQWKQYAPPMVPTPAEKATSALMFSNMFTRQGLAGLFSTHPSTIDRVKRLRTIDHRQ